MLVVPTLRLIAMVAVVVFGLTGCFRDQRSAVTAEDEECAAAALVAEGLIDSGGERNSAIIANLVALGEVASPDVRGVTNELVSLAEVDESSSTFRTKWYAVLDDLDRTIHDRCEFSIRALVTEVGLRSGSADDEEESLLKTATDSSVDVGLEAARPLDWDEIRSRVGVAGWLESGYRGLVGLGPGIHVTVYGVESAQLAMTVCDDTREALAPESSMTEVAIEVHGLGEGLLAQTVGGACIPR